MKGEAMKLAGKALFNTILSITLILGTGISTIPTAYADPFPKPGENWKTNFDKSSVPFEQILSGGPPKDGIPAIDEPKFIPVSEATVNDKDPVIGFEFNGDARAYPLSILMWHEIANDVVGGHAFTVTFCPLCNAAIVFDAEFDGMRHDFGTTGRLRNSDLLMYDRQSESWWQQFSGEAIIGEQMGKSLTIMPSRLESFASFKKRFPDGKILVPNNPNLRNYGRNPYAGYDGRSAPYPFYTGSLPSNINPMERVVILRRGKTIVSIVSLEKLQKLKTMEQSGFFLSWKPGRVSALDNSIISNSRDVGNLVVEEIVDGVRRDGVHDLTFAFVAHAFHPEIEIQQ